MKNNKEITFKEIYNKKFKFNRNVNGAGIPMGSILTINRSSSGVNLDSKVTSTTNLYSIEYPNSYVRLSEIEPLMINIEYLEDENNNYESKIKELKSLIENNKIKIKFIKENKIKEFSEEEFKVYAVLEAIEKSGTKLEKAQMIAKIINN
jgi:hypothetical protein